MGDTLFEIAAQPVPAQAYAALSMLVPIAARDLVSAVAESLGVS